MRKIMLAAALTAFAAGGAIAQEAPYTVMNGQIKYPGQLQWNAPVGGYYAPQGYYGEPLYGDAYYGSSSAVAGPYMTQPAFNDGGNSYNQQGPGIFVFTGENINNDQNYNGR